MMDRPTVEIVQYNCYNTNYNKARSLIDRFNLKVQKIIALQKPMEKKGTTYCPPGYKLAFEERKDRRATKMAIYVGLEVAAGTWKVWYYSPHVSAIDIDLDG